MSDQQRIIGSPGGAEYGALRRPDGSVVVDRSRSLTASRSSSDPLSPILPTIVGVHGSMGSPVPSQITKEAADISLAPPNITNPLLNSINFHLPYDYVSLNAWLRYYDTFHPLVGNSIDMHAEYPMSRFDLIDIEDPEILHFYEDMSEDIDLFQFLLDMNREYFLIGESFPFGHWDYGLNAWDEFVLLNPDLVIVKGIGFGSRATTRYEWKPPSEIRDLIHSNDPYDVQLSSKIDPLIIRAVQEGKNIPLSMFNLTHIARKQHRYHPRGISIVLRCLKDLLYEDKLIDAQHRVADMHITPLVVFKLGDPNKSWLPTSGDLDDFRQLIASGLGSNFHSIVSHYGLQVEYHGATGRVLPLEPEFRYVENRILTALFTNKAMTHGEGPTFSNAAVAAKFLNGRYMAIRGKAEMFAEEKIYYPVALANDFYKPVQRELNFRYRVRNRDRELWIPRLRWRGKLNLLDDTQHKQYIMNLRQRTEVSMRTVSEVFDLDYDKVKREIKEEEGTVFDPNYQAQRQQENMLMGPAPGAASPPTLPGAPSQPKMAPPQSPPPGEKADQAQTSQEQEQYTAETPATQTQQITGGRRVFGDKTIKRLKNIRARAKELVAKGKRPTVRDYVEAKRDVRKRHGMDLEQGERLASGSFRPPR